MSDIIISGSVAIERSLNDSDHAECGKLQTAISGLLTLLVNTRNTDDKTWLSQISCWWTEHQTS